jgi:membrane protease YdiL (CAAX protease family)
MGIILGVFAALGEEIGWRGLALPKLQEKHTAVTASVIIRTI